MERLTIPDYFYSDCEFADSGIAEYMNRLAAYEDTGLEPEDITNHFGAATIMKLAAQALGTTPERLRELAQADREGRVVVLPAKTVFVPTWDAGPKCDLRCPIGTDAGCCELCGKARKVVYDFPCKQEHIDQIGKTVFLTREGAENELHRMGEDDDA